MRSLLIVCNYNCLVTIQREQKRNNLNILQSKYSLLKFVVTLFFFFAEMGFRGGDQTHVEICYMELMVYKYVLFIYLFYSYIYFYFKNFPIATSSDS
jgi:hypothetical protein